jgi:hypothetical protein
VPAVRTQVDFQEIGIGGVLKQYRLVVPPNQREYSWTEREVTTLFEDLMRAISDEQHPEYFLGTIVTIPQSPDLLEVADGQQRLATTAILLTQMRNYLAAVDAEDLIAQSIEEDFLTHIDRTRRERVVKLSLNVDDNEFFRRMVNARKDSDRPQPSNNYSHKRIKEAFTQARKHIAKILAGYNKKDHGDVLDRWIRFLEHNAQVILLKVPTDANAYKMFETLNDRGLRVSQADLVKNYVFGQSSNERLTEAQQKWTRMRSILESLEEEDITVTFLRQAMIVIRGHLRESQVFDEVQNRVKGPVSSIQFLNQLEDMSAVYVAIFNPESDRWNRYPDAMRRGIETLNLLSIRSIRPLMLATAMKFSERDAAEAFRMFISWGVRLIIASSTSRGAVEEPLANAANAVFQGDITDPTSLKKALKNIIPVDEEFCRAFETANVSKAAFARYYLRTLERAAKNEATPWFIPNDDRQVINLEHILPEVPGDEWPRIDDETRKIYAKRIGNLALLLAKNNSDLGSDSFAKKKMVYATSPYELTRQIASVASWGPDEITSRQKILANLALKAWPL